MEYRPYYLSREWVRGGNAVQIVAGGYSHLRRKQPADNGSGITRRIRERIDGIEYLWYPTSPYQGNGVGRLRNIWTFLRQVWTDAERLVAETSPDVVIASSTYPLDIWVAKRLSRLAKAKLVFEIHDLWPLSPIELGGMSRRHPFIQLCQWAENTAYRDADAVVSMLPKVHEHVAEHGLDLSKLHIIPNGISPDDWQDDGTGIDGDLAQYIQSARDQGCLLVGYAGAHGLPNALDTFLDAAKLLLDKSFRFILVGDGHEKVLLQQRVSREGLNNVRMFAPIPKAQIPALLLLFDIAYIGWQRMQIYRFGISPNKLMDYMMAGCTVLHSVEAGNNPVADARCGLTVLPESPEAVADGLMKLGALSPAERQKMGLNGQAYVRANHVYPVLAQKFLTIMKGVK